MGGEQKVLSKQISSTHLYRHLYRGRIICSRGQRREEKKVVGNKISADLIVRH